MLLLLTGIAGGFGVLYLFVKFRIPWLTGDLKFIRYVFNFLWELTKNQKNNILPIDVFEKTADKYRDKTMIIYKDTSYSYAEVDRMANKIANVALGLGLKQGDTVAMLMYNEPTFIWTWLGFQKIGVEVAFLNFHQKKKTLFHSITTCGAKAVFLNKGADLYAAIEEIAADFENTDFYTFESPLSHNLAIFKSLSVDIKAAADDRISCEHRSNVNVNSTNCLIFTSGTTGLPKPAIVSQLKVHAGRYMFRYCDASADDILYEPLPLYHSAASILGVGSTINNGSTLALADKFSASRFFEDCHHHKVTIIHYVGEMCRYLLNTPKTSFDTNHNIRVAIGNGLRKDIWTEFQNRYQIKDIVEFYSSTDIPIGFVNIYNHVGAVGRITPLTKYMLPCAFVMFDVNTAQPIRNKMGRCIPVKTGNPGLLIGRLDDRIRFEGYKNNKDATSRNILRDVFRKGDTYVNSGDLLYCDEEYYIYFYDRLGDTFRWKGENVSTTEIANIISELPFITDTCVYGVSVPGCEGRTGMAAITLGKSERKMPSEEMILKIEEQCANELSSYAIPRFLRFRQTLDITSTFKQQKMTLKQEAFNVDGIQDPVYYYDVKSHKYCLLNKEIEMKIINQELQM